MRSARRLLQLFYDHYPCGPEGARHGIYLDPTSDTLFVNVFIGVDGNDFLWHQFELTDEDLDRNAIEVFRDIAPLLKSEKPAKVRRIEAKAT